MTLWLLVCFPDSEVERKASIQDLQSLAAAVEPELHGLHVAHAELSDPFVLRLVLS